MPPTDPTLYRFFEMIQVFGYPLKAIIHEKVKERGIHWIRFNTILIKLYIVW